MGMVDITEASAIVAAAGVVIGGASYILDMRNQARERQTDLVMRLYDKFGSEEFLRAFYVLENSEFKDFASYMEKSRSDPEVLPAFRSVATFFEGIGVLAKRHLINMDLVDDLFSYTIIQVWEKWKNIAKGIREMRKGPQLGEWFEYLYNEIKKRQQQVSKKA